MGIRQWPHGVVIPWWCMARLLDQTTTEIDQYLNETVEIADGMATAKEKAAAMRDPSWDHTRKLRVVWRCNRDHRGPETSRTT